MISRKQGSVSIGNDCDSTATQFSWSASTISGNAKQSAERQTSRFHDVVRMPIHKILNKQSSFDDTPCKEKGKLLPCMGMLQGSLTASREVVKAHHN